MEQNVQIQVVSSGAMVTDRVRDSLSKAYWNSVSFVIAASAADALAQARLPYNDSKHAGVLISMPTGSR